MTKLMQGDPMNIKIGDATKNRVDPTVGAKRFAVLKRIYGLRCSRFRSRQSR